MKIYTKIVMDMNFNVLEEESYEHEGIIADCKGGSPSPPPPSATEVELQQLQIADLKRRAEMERNFEPLLLENMGFGIAEDGSYYRLPEEVDELSQLYEERSLAAARGELDISPALRKGLDQSMAQTEEGLARRLGSDYIQTTPGLSSQAEAFERNKLIEEEARYGQIGQGDALLTSRMTTNAGLNQSGFNTYSALGAGTSPAMFQSALSPFQSQRQAQFQGNVAGAANSAMLTSSAYGALGTAIGAYAGSRGGTTTAPKTTQSVVT